MITVSFGFTKDYCAVVLIRDGKMEKNITSRLREYDNNSTFLRALECMRRAMNLTKFYIDENPDVDEIVFECNNNTVINWVKRGYSKDEYDDLFFECLLKLHEIPVKYSFKHNPKTVALKYANKNGIREDKLERL